MNIPIDSEIKLKLLSLLAEDPQLTQREMHQNMGVSLGKVNYCLTALIEKGMVKVERFKKHKSKAAYMYHLTPKGMESLGMLTLNFLKIKIREYDGIKKEIRILSEQMSKIDPKLGGDLELLKNLKNLFDN